jgi:mono/diheme cytochrome c family protein
MPKPTLVWLLLCLPALAQEKPAPKIAYHPVPIADVRRPNPVKPTPESIASGKKIYGYDCAICHGEDGVGKTSAGKQMKIPDLTDPALQKQRTDGEFFYVIKNGRNEMPLEGDRAKTDEMWDLVNYVRTLEKKKAATEEKPPS